MLPCTRGPSPEAQEARVDEQVAEVAAAPLQLREHADQQRRGQKQRHRAAAQAGRRHGRAHRWDGAPGGGPLLLILYKHCL